ncbi:MAG: hypothetical protein KDD40_10420, partial [Bdellovibrionales bacterium]|nr:hypothetical protein [Bdellovibrionales bacterium]
MTKTDGFKISIRIKLMLYAVTLIICLSGLLTFHSINNESQRIKTIFRNSASKTTQFISSSVYKQLKYQNLDAVQRILESADANPNIEKILISDKFGQPIFNWSRNLKLKRLSLKMPNKILKTL